jgi:hypothetical protein
MKIFIAYVAFIIVVAAFGVPWYQAAAYPWFVGFIFGLFYVAFKPAKHDIMGLVFIVIAMVAAIPCAAGFGKASHHWDDRHLSSEDY